MRKWRAASSLLAAALRCMQASPSWKDVAQPRSTTSSLCGTDERVKHAALLNRHLSATPLSPRSFIGPQHRRYCLAFLEEGALPWQWEPKERVTSIKKKLFVEECAISGDECDAQLLSDEACSTAHCLRTYESWDCSEALHELWGVVLESRAGGAVDYDACLLALEDASAA